MASFSKKCFFISPIGKSGTKVRENANKTYAIIQSIVEKYGYSIYRADKHDKSGSITRKIFDDIIKSDLIIADLTRLNSNVLYRVWDMSYNR